LHNAVDPVTSKIRHDTSRIHDIAFLSGIFVWILDSVVDVFMFNPAGKSFWHIIIDPDPHEIFMRLMYIVIILAAAVIVSRFTRHRTLIRKQLEHQKKVLAAIRMSISLSRRSRMGIGCLKEHAAR